MATWCSRHITSQILNVAPDTVFFFFFNEVSPYTHERKLSRNAIICHIECVFKKKTAKFDQIKAPTSLFFL